MAYSIPKHVPNRDTVNLTRPFPAARAIFVGHGGAIVLVLLAGLPQPLHLQHLVRDEARLERAAFRLARRRPEAKFASQPQVVPSKFDKLNRG
jgi:hypothetical protein